MPLDSTSFGETQTVRLLLDRYHTLRTQKVAPGVLAAILADLMRLGVFPTLPTRLP